MEEVPIQDFQSVIAIELGAAGALMWEIGFFGGGNQTAAAALLIGLTVSLLPSCVERCPGSSAQMASPELPDCVRRFPSLSKLWDPVMPPGVVERSRFSRSYVDVRVPAEVWLP